MEGLKYHCESAMGNLAEPMRFAGDECGTSFCANVTGIFFVLDKSEKLCERGGGVKNEHKSIDALSRMQVLLVLKLPGVEKPFGSVQFVFRLFVCQRALGTR